MPFFLERCRIPNDMIEAFILPQRAGSAHDLVDLIRRVALGRMQDFRQRPEFCGTGSLPVILGQRTQQKMYMIGHDDDLPEVIPPTRPVLPILKHHIPGVPW